MATSPEFDNGDTIWTAVAIGSIGFPVGTLSILLLAHFLPQHFVFLLIAFKLFLFVAAFAIDMYGKVITNHMSWPMTAYSEVSTVGKRLYAFFFAVVFCILGIVFGMPLLDIFY